MANPFTVWPPAIEDLHWLAGLFEGDGSFYLHQGRPAIGLGMNDEDIVARAAELMGVSYQTTLLPSGKPRYVFTIYGYTRAVPIMKTLRPLMGERRKRQIDKALSEDGSDMTEGD